MTTVPAAPVRVTVLPTTFAGPDTTLYVTASLEEAVAFSVKGAAPTFWLAIAGKVMVCGSSETVKLCLTAGAAAKVELPAWLAWMTTVPAAPVSVTVLPETFAGPDTRVYVTASWDEAVAVNVNA